MSHERCTCTKPRHETRRIVFTGGPGAGKTAVLAVLRRMLCAHVRVLPEAASIVFAGGFPRPGTPIAIECAQRAIHHVQVELETLAHADHPAVVLCDRGVVDGLAYWPGDEGDLWKSVGMSREEALARYDLVIHLRVPTADGGYDHSNPVRLETSDEARIIDERIAHAWRGHPNVAIIHNATDFGTKLEKAIALVMNEIPSCCR
jgi:predicted ATPase